MLLSTVLYNVLLTNKVNRVIFHELHERVLRLEFHDFELIGNDEIKIVASEHATIFKATRHSW